MKRIFVTGGTGFIGSFLTVELLKKGYELVLLARRTRRDSAQERIDRVLRFVEPDIGLYRGRYRVVEGDVTLPGLGMVGDDPAIGRIDAFFHLAASTDFSEKKREKTCAVNCAGTENSLSFCSSYGINSFHHVSTLFVAGNREGNIFENDLDCGQTFANPYEETKMTGEKLVRKWVEGQPERTYRVYRLPVVCGHSRTGKTTIFSNLYGFLAAFWMLKQNIIKKFEQDGKGLMKAGIYRDEDNNVHIPVQFTFSSSSSSLELIPVDWVTDRMVKLFEKQKSENHTFHFAYDKPPRGIVITEQCLKMMGLRDMKILDDLEEGNDSIPEQHPVLMRLQKNIDMLIGRFTDYTVGRKYFDNYNMRQVLGDEYLPPPVMDEKMIKTLMDFAMEHNFRSVF